MMSLMILLTTNREIQFNNQKFWLPLIYLSSALPRKEDIYGT